jgi:dynein heavy chain
MDWYMAWPKDALIAVADHSLGKFEISCTPEVKKAVVETMGVVQDMVGKSCEDYFEQYRRRTYVTPASYLSFLNGYRDLYSDKKKVIDVLGNQMKTGLNKLAEAGESVAQLSEELKVKDVELQVANKETEEVLKTVTAASAKAEKIKAEVQVIKDKAQAIVDAIDKDKTVAEAKLAAAVPALEAAEKALETITAGDIATVKKLGKPPHLIKRIMDVVVILFGQSLDPVVPDEDVEGKSPIPTWSSALKVMSGPMLQQLMTFNKDTISEEMVELCDVYIRMEDYNLERAKKVAGAVAGLTSWTEAMCTFYWINKEVLPLKANLAVAEVKLAKAQAELDEAQATLDEKQAELDKVQATYDATMKKKKELQDDADTCQRKMTSASALIEGLGGEKVRWTEQSQMFDAQIRCLVGDVLVMCAFMSYSGPLNADFRGKLMTAWRQELETVGIPFTKKMDIVAELVDNVTAAEWGIQGLPVDPLSMQNGIITTKATRYPLMIDPQGQGKSWIKAKEEQNQLQVTTLGHKYFRAHLEDSLGNGRPLLIEDVGESLDPCLDNVLAKNFIKSGSTFKVKVGDKECDVMKGFQLYVTTKLANPAYTPEIFAATSIIDFTVTMAGLEDQLLARVIQFEKAELEEERIALATEVTANKKKMKELEDNLLFKLVNTKGSLVDDESLIQVLQVTKVTAVDVNEKIRIADETSEKISLAREEYRPIAIRGSILYFLIVELSMVNPMYQTSLDQFLAVFTKSLNEATPSPVAAKRIHNVIEYLTYATYCYTIRGLYSKDKFLLTILLALKCDIRKGKVKKSEFDIFIKGGGSLDLNAVEPKPKPWILDLTWLNIVQLSNLPVFSDLPSQVARNASAWKSWFDEAEPEEVTMPDGFDKLSTFEKLLLIRAWCPDRITSQARKYIVESLGERYGESVITDLNGIFEESTINVPMVCFLSLGSDPTQSIMDLAKEKKLDCRDISMGQGQEVHARRLVANFQESGGWVLLQNCHLALDFMPELQASVQDKKDSHEDFRLWLTTEEHPKFPINLLQASLKFTNEPPQGVKAGLKRTFAGITQDKLDISNFPQWKPMLFGVCILHSVVQERRKFGPLGWNIPYEFNAGDLHASTQMVQNAMDDMDPHKGVIWQAIRYHLGEVQYGGRVTDDQDKRLLNTFADAWFTDKMFEPDFEFAKGYPLGNFAKIEQYFEFLETLPSVDRPGVFGLHANADITCQTAVGAGTLNTILDIQPKDSGGGGGETREEAVARMCKDFLEKLPADFVKHDVVDRLKAMGYYQPLNIFLRQEIDRMQAVIGLVRFTLSQLLLAIDGTIIMSSQLQNAFDNMYDARVPTHWSKISWLSTTLGFWYTELLDRHAQFYSWCFDGRPKSFWMTGFFNANGFTTAMRQEITRAHKGWALDVVVTASEVTKIQTFEDVTKGPSEGVYIHGLFLDGAGWNKSHSCLTEQHPKVLYVSLPILHLFAINTTSGRDTRLYECPIYKKPRRTDLEYICMVDLKTGVDKAGNPIHPNHWVLRGTALLCDTK